jgi:D-3-phosphoglycerate dehydrogenase / 2-oxoglutarate reductase
MPYRVIATARSFCNTPGAHLDYLAAHGCELEKCASAHPLKADELADLVSGCDGLILGLDQCNRSVIERADKLKVISRYGVGVDEVDLEAASTYGIAVTNTPGGNASGVLELTIGLMFALARQIPQVASAAKQGQWLRSSGWELGGKTLGLIGLGAIGREVARRARALDMRVIGCDPFAGEVLGVERGDLAWVLGEADIVSLHAPLMPETANIINRETIALMKDGAYLVNTARGGLVDEGPLYEALKSGKLAGAAADVFQHDPPQNSPLFTLDNFIGTPHIGATTREAVLKTALMAAENLVAVLEGKSCPYIVNQAGLNAKTQSRKDAKG